MYLAYTRQSFITANLLSRFLGIEKSKNIKSYPPIIRWGNSMNSFDKDDTQFNRPELIDISSSKLKTFRMLSSNNINCVEYISGFPHTFPVLIRTLLNSSKGRGIIIVNNKDEYKDDYNYYYHSPLIPFEREFRVHVLGGKIAKIMEKIPLNSDENTIIKNSETCTFKRKDINLLKCGNLISEIIEKLYNVFPMQMMGVDLGIFDNKAFVIEINSAPSLNSLTLELYGNYLRENCL